TPSIIVQTSYERWWRAVARVGSVGAATGGQRGAWTASEALHRIGRSATAQDVDPGPLRAPSGDERGRRGRERVCGCGVVEHERALVQEGKHQGALHVGCGRL